MGPQNMGAWENCWLCQNWLHELDIFLMSTRNYAMHIYSCGCKKCCLNRKNDWAKFTIITLNWVYKYNSSNSFFSSMPWNYLRHRLSFSFILPSNFNNFSGTLNFFSNLIFCWESDLIFSEPVIKQHKPNFQTHNEMNLLSMCLWTFPEACVL